MVVCTIGMVLKRFYGSQPPLIQEISIGQETIPVPLDQPIKFTNCQIKRIGIGPEYYNVVKYNGMIEFYYNALHNVVRFIWSKEYLDQNKNRIEYMPIERANRYFKSLYKCVLVDDRHSYVTINNGEWVDTVYVLAPKGMTTIVSDRLELLKGDKT